MADAVLKGVKWSSVFILSACWIAPALGLRPNAVRSIRVACVQVAGHYFRINSDSKEAEAKEEEKLGDNYGS